MIFSLLLFALSPTARYSVQIVREHPLAAHVTAALPLDGNALEMSSTRPGDIPELDSIGWTALVRNLSAHTTHGETIHLARTGATGWKTDHPYHEQIKLEYDIDLSLLKDRGWPAPREAAYDDGNQISLVARGLFITTPASHSITVSFTLPQGLRILTPWRSRQSSTSFALDNPDDLVDNFIVFTRRQAARTIAGNWRITIASFGEWQHATSISTDLASRVTNYFVSLMHDRDAKNYVVVLLPQLETGGESYRSSFGFNFDSIPTTANRARWGNTIAHEIFHQWNGWKLKGADYSSSQWFQEGFTEYEANRALLETHLITPSQFEEKMETHVGNYGRLTTTLENIGTHKGKPLYSAGALVAFSWDMMIRQSTGGKRNLGDFLRALMKRTDGGKRPYKWDDIEAALNETANLNWADFHKRYIAGNEKLPLDTVWEMWRKNNQGVRPAA